MSKEMKNVILPLVAVLAILVVIYVLYTIVKFIALHIVLPIVIVAGLFYAGYLTWKALK